MPRVDGQGRPMDLRVTTVDPNLFALFGVPPALGRDFTAADAAPGSLPVLMLSHRMWLTHFAGRADIIGSVVHINGMPAQIVGVMPEGFAFPEVFSEALWMPIVRSTWNGGIWRLYSERATSPSTRSILAASKPFASSSDRPRRRSTIQNSSRSISA